MSRIAASVPLLAVLLARPVGAAEPAAPERIIRNPFDG